MRRNTKRQPRKKIILGLVADRKWAVIGEPEWLELQAAVPGLRTEDLRKAGVGAEAPWCGVAQHTLEELEMSLLELAGVYGARADLRKFCRAEVIRARDRARVIAVAGAVPEETKALKREMVEWMLVWLGDPALFEAWVKIRRVHVFSPHQNSDFLT